MKMERLSQDKIRIFLTFDDLTERGIQKDDMWKEIPKVHELFSEMMDQAYTELGFEPSGQLAVEVLALPAQGMVVIVTRAGVEFSRTTDAFDEDGEEVYELEVTLEQTDQITYLFHDFEDLLRMAKVLKNVVPQGEGGMLFSYKGKWIYLMEAEEMEESLYQSVIAVLSEFGEAASVTRAVLEEYGKNIIEHDAVYVLDAQFK